MVKKVRTTAEDELMASIALDVDVVAISPRHSPQREATTHFPLVSVGVEKFIANIGKGAGEVRHEEERPEADPTITPPSTTAPATDSPARASTDEPVRTDEMPATGAADNQAMTTGFVEEVVPPQQSQSGKFSAVKYFSSLIPFFS
jgi:hypothetical protein